MGTRFAATAPRRGGGPNYFQSGIQRDLARNIVDHDDAAICGLFGPDLIDSENGFCTFATNYPEDCYILLTQIIV
jgi:hypothetical protein